MQKGKKSFLLYYDFEEQTQALTDEQVGRLIRIMLAYEKREEFPEAVEPEVLMAFLFLKSGLDCNQERYQRMCQRNRKNRLKGCTNPAEVPVVTTGTDTDTDKDTDIDTEKETDILTEE